MNTDPTTTYALLYLEINLMSVLLIGIIRHKTGGLTQMVAQRNFAMSINAMTVFFLSDTIHVLISNGLLPHSRGLILAAKSAYFLSTTLMCFFWFVYFEHMQGSPFVRSPRRVRIASCLVWVMGALLVVNLFTGLLFYVDANGEYRRGPWFLLLYLISYIYVFITSFRALVSLFRETQYLRRRMLISLVLFPIGPAIAGVLLFLYPQFPVACAVLSLLTLLMYLNFVEEMISIDPLTRLNNRKQLAYHYEQWTRNLGETVPLYLLIIDANKFKAINDTYGHIQGDAALARIAEALRLGCRGCRHRANIARWGGDEFIILAAAESPADIDALRERIDAALADLNREAQAPYDLSVCIGVAQAMRGLPLKTVIEMADANLYREKKRMKRS